jgi:hypothetical protein
VVGKEIFLLVWEVYNKHFGTFCVFGIFVEGITRALNFKALSVKANKVEVFVLKCYSIQNLTTKCKYSFFHY